MNKRCLSYRTLSSQDDTLIMSIRKIVAAHNAEHLSDFSYREVLDRSTMTHSWIVSDANLSFPLVVGDPGVSYEPVVSLDSGSPEEALFYNIFEAVSASEYGVETNRADKMI